MTIRTSPKSYHYHFASPPHLSHKLSKGQPQSNNFFGKNARISFNYTPQSQKNDLKEVAMGSETDRMMNTKEEPVNLARKYTFSMIGRGQLALKKSVSREEDRGPNLLPKPYPLLSKKTLPQMMVKPLIEINQECSPPKTPKIKSKAELFTDSQSTERKNETQQLQGKIEGLIQQNQILRAKIVEMRNKTELYDKQVFQPTNMLKGKHELVLSQKLLIDQWRDENQKLKKETEYLRNIVNLYQNKQKTLKIDSKSVNIKVESDFTSQSIMRQLNLQKNPEENTLAKKYQQILKQFSIDQYQPKYHEILTNNIKELKDISEDTSNFASKCEQLDKKMRNMLSHIKKQELDLSKLHHINMLLSNQLKKNQQTNQSNNEQITILNLRILQQKYQSLHTIHPQ